MRNLTVKIISAACFVAAAFSIAAGDQVDVKGASLECVIQKFDPETLQLGLRTRGSEFSRSLAEVSKIAINGQEAFNKAEEAGAAGKLSDAIRSYAAAYKESKKEWVKQLIEFRRYQTLAKAKRIDLSIKTWLGLVEKYGSTPAILAIAPTNVAAAGSTYNQAGLDIIAQQIKTLAVERKKNRKFIEALLKVRMAIQNGSGDTAAAGETAEMLANFDTANLTGEKPAEAAPSEGATPAKSGDDEAAGGDDEAAPVATIDLGVLDQLYQSGKYDKVIATLTGKMNEFGDDQMPEVLILLANAQIAKYRQTKDRGLLIDAGLNLMMVYSEFGDESVGAEALYLAAGVNGMLDQKAAQRAAIEDLLSRYSEEGPKFKPWVEKAAAELQKFKQQK